MIDPPEPPVFPSDLPNAPGDELRLAGRVISVGADAIWLADAFAVVRLMGAVDVEVGDLVVLSVRRSRDGASAGALLERHRPAGGERDEQARFIEGGVGAHLRARATAFAVVRAFFTRRGFVEVDTPLLVPSPGLDVHLDAIEAGGDYLVTSPEYQMKRLLVGGVPRLFQLTHVFRKGELGMRHNPEFTMLEWYRAFATVDDVVRDTEELVVEVFQALGSRAPRLPFARMSVREAFQRFASVDETEFFRMAEQNADAYFRLLVDKVEPALSALTDPIFLVDFPVSHASLARAKPTDPRVCERFELYVGGVELCNGFGELTDPHEQRRRLLGDQRERASLGKPVYPIDERFLKALEEGMPPSGGNALGVDRLLALCLGEREIGRVMPFPSGIV